MGFLLSFSVALVESAKNVFIKKSTQNVSAVFSAWVWQITSLILLVPFLIFRGMPEVQSSFWIYALLKMVLMATAMFLYNSSLKKTDLSLALPMLAITPLVTSIFSFFLSQDIPSKLGVVGIFIIMVGIYMLNKKNGSGNGRGLLEPFENIFRDKGVFYMFLVAVIWGVSTSIDKEGVLTSSVAYYGVVSTVLTALFLTPFVLHSHRKNLKEAINFKNFMAVLPVGVADGLVVILQFSAYKFILAAYVIAIKRSSIVMSAILANLFFKEDVKGRVFPILVMLSGLVLVVIS